MHKSSDMYALAIAQYKIFLTDILLMAFAYQLQYSHLTANLQLLHGTKHSNQSASDLQATSSG